MRRYFISTICVILIFISVVSSNVNATTEYGFKTTPLSEDIVNQIWSAINIKSSSDVPSLNAIGLQIVSFDVSKNSEILLGFKDNKIAIVNDGEVQQFFEFSNDGLFYVRWKENNILLFLVRGSVIVEFSTKGELINIVQADSSNESNNSLWNEIAKRKEVSINQYTFSIRNKSSFFSLFSSSFSQLIKTDSNGNETIIYDVSSDKAIRFVVLSIAIIIFILIVFLIIFRRNKLT